MLLPPLLVLAFPDPFGDSNAHHGFDMEPWSGPYQETSESARLQGNSRGYFRSWSAAGNMQPPTRFNLTNAEMRFTVDVSGVPCGCNAAVYFVAMPDSQYCDAWNGVPGIDGGMCTEVDLMEANSVSFASTLHTETGWRDNACNADGCGVKLGPLGRGWRRCAFGGDCAPSGGHIDASQPYEVYTAMDEDGHMFTSLRQGSVTLPVYSGAVARWQETAEAREHLRERMAQNVFALVASIWTSADGTMAWLDGGCDAPCDVSAATVTISAPRVTRGFRQECWAGCGEAAGYCPQWCGAELACCRHGASTDAGVPECAGVVGCVGQHCCTRPLLDGRPTTPPPSPPLPSPPLPPPLVCEGQMGASSCEAPFDYDQGGQQCECRYTWTTGCEDPTGSELICERDNV